MQIIQASHQTFRYTLHRVCRQAIAMPALIGLLLAPQPSAAAEVALAGVIGSKAILVVNGGQPRTIAVGQQTPEGVRLIAIEAGRDAARVEVGGITQRLELGRSPVSVSAAPSNDAALTLLADGKGHHFADGNINGSAIRFIVDTGASAIAIGRSDAQRAGINLSGATQVMVQTASGADRAWRVRLDTVKVGPLVMHGVDALVMNNDLPVALLGMTFLSRTEMRHEGNRLTLRKRF